MAETNTANPHSGLTGAYVTVRQFFQPYYRYWPKSEYKSTPKAKQKKDLPRKANISAKQKAIDAATQSCPDVITIPEVHIHDYPAPLTNVLKFKTKPSPGHIWCYHGKDLHQVVGHFVPGAGFKFQGRDGKARRNLQPLIYVDIDEPFDRTHLIPFGYHGLEDDNRLLVGWPGDMNRGPLNEFEQQQKRLTEPIYWIVSLKRFPWGIRWQYAIVSVKSGAHIASLKGDYQGKYVWK